MIPSNMIFTFKSRTVLEKLRIPIRKNSEGEGEGVSYKGTLAHRVFKPGESEFLSMKGKLPHLKCVIIKKIGNVTYEVMVGDQVRSVHANQLIKSDVGHKTNIPTRKPLISNPQAPSSQRPKRNVKKTVSQILKCSFDC